MYMDTHTQGFAPASLIAPSPQFVPGGQLIAGPAMSPSPVAMQPSVPVQFTPQVIQQPIQYQLTKSPSDKLLDKISLIRLIAFIFCLAGIALIIPGAIYEAKDNGKRMKRTPTYDGGDDHSGASAGFLSSGLFLAVAGILFCACTFLFDRERPNTNSPQHEQVELL